ncbi:MULTISPECIES: DUF2782 domain-containing protein [unclassified Thioalkalivibrio]|uniref:DUF2782 domain-containing protein n=1 Tax=unclassified Thioalkalivibrio TaxID=2621013 RepID=UPI00037D72EE|nr:MULTISPECIES: DUF2782 domain-containing protein [unclassified Thioalkalivibrio]
MAAKCTHYSAAILAGLFLAPALAIAQQEREWDDAPPPPEMPDEAEADPAPPVLDERAREQRGLEEADIVIIERDGETRREYRMGGQLVMVEVIPAAGPSYYLIDSTGDGLLDRRQRELEPDFVPPSWVIFQW